MAEKVIRRQVKPESPVALSGNKSTGDSRSAQSFFQQLKPSGLISVRD
jgi:hypothetical protein